MGGVRWTEWLNGWMSFDQTDFNQATLEGKRDGRKLGAELTLQIDDVAKFIESPRRLASVYSGFIDSPDLGGRLNVSWGEFELLAPSSDLFDHLHLRMRYRLNDQPVDALVSLQRVDGRWYLTDYLRHARAAVASEAVVATAAP